MAISPENQPWQVWQGVLSRLMATLLEKRTFQAPGPFCQLLQPQPPWSLLLRLLAILAPLAWE